MLELLEEALQSVELDWELWVPRLGAREATMFHPGYGLIPCPEKALWTRIGGDSDRFPKVVFVLRTMRKLVQEGRRTTKRDIFYENFALFSNQGEVDRLVAELVALLQVPRLMLGVVATSKGLVVGDLSYLNNEDIMVDCSLTVGGDTIPQDVLDLRHLRTRASFLLIVEKDAVFQRLLEEGVFATGLPLFLMVTGKGVPDLATRQLVYRLTTEFSLPTFILTDCDLHIWHRDCPHHSSFRRERALGGSRCGVKQSWQEALLMPPASCLTELLTRKRVILQDKISSSLLPWETRITFLWEKPLVAFPH